MKSSRSLFSPERLMRPLLPASDRFHCASATNCLSGRSLPARLLQQGLCPHLFKGAGENRSCVSPTRLPAVLPCHRKLASVVSTALAAFKSPLCHMGKHRKTSGKQHHREGDMSQTGRQRMAAAASIHLPHLSHDLFAHIAWGTQKFRKWMLSEEHWTMQSFDA